jgi:hypothetical protein
VRRFYSNTKPLFDSEMNSIRSKEDIVSLRSGREWVSLNGRVEGVISELGA